MTEFLLRNLRPPATSPMPRSDDSTTPISITDPISGPWGNLPPFLFERIFLFLASPDMCGYLSMLSRGQTFKPTEQIYRDLCESIYVSQTIHGRLRLSNWVTWKNMIVSRPRLRTNGFYCLRTVHSRAPCNDNFWEPKRLESIEVELPLDLIHTSCQN